MKLIHSGAVSMMTLTASIISGVIQATPEPQPVETETLQSNRIQADPVTADIEAEMILNRAGVTSEPAPKAEPEEKAEPRSEDKPSKKATTADTSKDTPEKPAIAKAEPQSVDNTYNIHVGLSGGQSAIDLCQGPVHFTPLSSSVFITEHDYCGGWSRFSHLPNGQDVKFSGNVAGTYEVTGRIEVFQGDTDAELARFAEWPDAVIQTCIPETNRMLLISLERQ